MSDDTEATPRTTDAELTINPGYIHEQRLLAVIGRTRHDLLNERLATIPPQAPAWTRLQATRQMQVDALMRSRLEHLPTLEEALERKLPLFCSIEQFEPIPSDHMRGRINAHWVTRIPRSDPVVFRFSGDKIFATTLREWLIAGRRVAVVGQLERIEAGWLILPVIIGEPWLEALEGNFDLSWHRDTHFELRVEDIDQFSRVRDLPLPADCAPMEQIGERGFKLAMARLLGDAISGDWGGEPHDYLGAHVTVSGRARPAAFVFKGPGRGFKTLSLEMLGKRANQILRLSESSASLLVVQHCHDIGEDVRKTLRAFAVRPFYARWYCFIDGRDSLRLLDAYGLREFALGAD